MKKRKTKKNTSKNKKSSNTNYVIAAVAVVIVVLFIGTSFYSATTGTKFGSGQVENKQDEKGFEREIASEIARVNQFPDDGEAWTRLGNLYFDSGQADKSIESYQQSLRINKNNPDVWTDMGVMYRETKNYTKALESFAAAIELDPKHEIARLNRGIVLLYDLNDKPGAVKAWQELLAINPAAVTPEGTPLAGLVKDLAGAKSYQLLAPTKPGA
jgi:tetratricopeptide (TPR) repeat protein